MCSQKNRGAGGGGGQGVHVKPMFRQFADLRRGGGVRRRGGLARKRGLCFRGAGGLIPNAHFGTDYYNILDEVHFTLRG